MTLWRFIIWFLSWLAADPVEVNEVQCRAAAAGYIARASMLPDAPEPAPPAPKDCVCGETCKNGIWKPDGRIEEKCTCDCDRCRKEREVPPPLAPPAPAPLKVTPKSCPGGQCPKPTVIYR